MPFLSSTKQEELLLNMSLSTSNSFTTTPSSPPSIREPPPSAPAGSQTRPTHPTPQGPRSSHRQILELLRQGSALPMFRSGRRARSLARVEGV